MNKFLDIVKKITGSIALVTGVVAAVAAALSAFTDEMKKRYPEGETVKSD